MLLLFCFFFRYLSDLCVCMFAKSSLVFVFAHRRSDLTAQFCFSFQAPIAIKSNSHKHRESFRNKANVQIASAFMLIPLAMTNSVVDCKCQFYTYKLACLDVCLFVQHSEKKQNVKSTAVWLSNALVYHLINWLQPIRNNSLLLKCLYSKSVN